MHGFVCVCLNVDCCFTLYLLVWCQTAKNLVLAGMNVTLHDSSVVEMEDMSALYFATLEEVGQQV